MITNFDNIKFYNNSFYDLEFVIRTNKIIANNTDITNNVFYVKTNFMAIDMTGQTIRTGPDVWYNFASRLVNFEIRNNTISDQ